MTEATAIERDGRVAHGDLGICSDGRLTSRDCNGSAIMFGGRRHSRLHFSHTRDARVRRNGHGKVSGPLNEDDADAATAVAAGQSNPRAAWPRPRRAGATFTGGIDGVLRSYADAAARADAAGFEVIEVHAGHGYLIASFLSPVINTRNDEYGGDFAGRIRFAFKVAEAVRSRWPQNKPLIFRLSSVDGHPEGWKIEDFVNLARELKRCGVDIIDCSSGGLRQSTALENAKRYPGYQVAYASQIKSGADIATVAVGI